MMKSGGEQYELKKSKKPNIALANTEQKLNLYAKQSYHIQGLKQAEWGFWLSIAGAVVGFLIIAVALFIHFFIKDISESSSFITLIAGSVIESVSLLFFYISNKASERVNDSFDKLRIDANIVNAIELAKGIDNTDLKDEVKVKLSLHLAGLNCKHICSCEKSTSLNKVNNEIEDNTVIEVNETINESSSITLTM